MMGLPEFSELFEAAIAPVRTAFQGSVENRSVIVGVKVTCFPHSAVSL